MQSEAHACFGKAGCRLRGQEAAGQVKGLSGRGAAVARAWWSDGDSLAMLQCPVKRLVGASMWINICW